MRKLLLLLLLFTAVFSSAVSQDAQYSSFYKAPLYLNPGLTGISKADLRLGGIYRSQWSSIPSPFQSYNFYLDKNNERVSYGLLFNQNNTGREGLKTTNVLLSLALKKRLTEGNNFLSVGLQLGLLQHRLNPSAGTFDSQYNPEKGYDADLPTGEQFDFFSLALPDINVGVDWWFSKDFGIPIEGHTGISFSHINRPKATFLNENFQFPLTSRLYAMAEMEMIPGFGIEPFVFFAGQQNFRQFIYGMNTVFYLNGENKLKLGLGNREQDAILLYSSLQFKNINIGLAFDTNFSKIENTFNRRTFELSITYLIKNDEKEGQTPEPRQLANPFADLKDFDGDGVIDEEDFCPYEAGSVEYQGCNDADDDGIWDHMDACPSLPGKIENYGCPVKSKGQDSDNDGVPDTEDECVYIPGLKALNGCPDSDSDGISDQYDNCPYLKGEKSNNGCPEKSIAQAEDNIEFETDKATIRKLYYPFLDRIAFQLKNRNDLKLVIEGHTDQEGNHLYNYHLSQKRAVNVQGYLLQKGVSEDQLELHFFGETKPKVTEQNEEARRKNRRVTLFLVNR